jgi:AcrR family transcriptional regulator
MGRLSRADSQRRTRRTLVRTARELFLRDGYFATSLERVAETAGYSKGAVYSNFASKDDLCLAVLDLVVAERARELVGALASATDTAGRIAAAENWVDEVTADRGWITLEVECASQVRGDPRLRAALAERAAARRTSVAKALSVAAVAAGTTLPAPAEDLATALISAGLGLAMQRAVDPTLEVRPVFGTFAALVAGLADGAAGTLRAPV